MVLIEKTGLLSGKAVFGKKKKLVKKNRKYEYKVNKT